MSEIIQAYERYTKNSYNYKQKTDDTITEINEEKYKLN